MLCCWVHTPGLDRPRIFTIPEFMAIIAALPRTAMSVAAVDAQVPDPTTVVPETTASMRVGPTA